MSTSWGDTPPGITGTHYGAATLGTPGAQVPGAGSNGPGYLYVGLVLPADAAKEVRGPLTRWPAAGALTVYEDSSFSYAGASDYALFRLYVDGVASAVDIGYGAGIGRFDLNVGTPSDLAGDVVLDAAVAGGALSGGNASALSGGVSADNAVAAGAMGTAPPSSLGGDVTAGDAVAAGTLTGDVSQVVPPMGWGSRKLRPLRFSPQRLAPLDTAEVDNLTADFAIALDPDDPIVDALVTCEARVGVDAAARPLLFGAHQVQGRLVRQRIKGSLGLVGVTYLLRVVAITASGLQVPAAGFIKVWRRG